ncbi:PB1 domain, RWP-RK domain, Lambda repressor-like, DNA-binding domain protein [Artemisia annua]|uniref:PB1 domain, RWP-RK domain, Lambda repressor-like, DNA-binding domain protein n=1 Tax=Artemisia annua TaxID=35608 RepID=A0A2U1KVR3_ARTAN|nr:PB1 domain, RWP-RK domain, Lambda repressor-like, DNA-binding domain protein [Artemisia annua]
MYSSTRVETILIDELGQPKTTLKNSVKPLTIKATYKEDTVRFPFILSDGLTKLKEQITTRFPLKLESFRLKYEDKDGDIILIACDSDLDLSAKDFERPDGHTVIRVVIPECKFSFTNPFVVFKDLCKWLITMRLFLHMKPNNILGLSHGLLFGHLQSVGLNFPIYISEVAVSDEALCTKKEINGVAIIASFRLIRITATFECKLLLQEQPRPIALQSRGIDSLYLKGM